jgi:hypothetical protein
MQNIMMKNNFIMSSRAAQGAKQVSCAIFAASSEALRSARRHHGDGAPQEARAILLRYRDAL